MRNDEDVTMHAVTGIDHNLCHASSESMRMDQEVVMATVKQNGSALGHAHGDMQNNEWVVRTAVAQNGLALTFASKQPKMTKMLS